MAADCPLSVKTVREIDIWLPWARECVYELWGPHCARIWNTE